MHLKTVVNPLPSFACHFTYQKRVHGTRCVGVAGVGIAGVGVAAQEPTNVFCRVPLRKWKSRAKPNMYLYRYMV